MRKSQVAVFMTVNALGGEKWSGYTMFYRKDWHGFVGIYEVDATTHREAIREAINKAKAARQSPAPEKEQA